MKLKCLSSFIILPITSSFAALSVPGEFVVKFKDQPISFEKSSNIVLQKNILNSREDIQLIKIANYKVLDQTIKKLKLDDRIEYIEPNYIYTKNNADPKFSKLWGLLNTGRNEPAGSRGNSSPSGVSGADINALDAWTVSKGSRDVTIAVIDTGIDYNHEDLKNNIWVNNEELNGLEGVDDDGNGYVDDIHGYDFANDDGDPMDGNGHGTHCAGTIAAEHNSIGVAGVMEKATLIGVKFLGDSGSGSLDGALKSIEYATKLNVDIMSNSWGGGGHSQIMEDLINEASSKGIVFVAAAGNSSTNNDVTPHYPSNYQVGNVISVAAHNYNDQLASFSCYGVGTVHVVAPGRNILSTVPNDKYDVFSGTSMATPHVTGVVGLYIAKNGRPKSVESLRQRLMDTSVYGRSYERKVMSMGRVNAYNFLEGIFPDRPDLPTDDQWETYTIGVESNHPYENSSKKSWNITVPGAKFIRPIFKKVDVEKYYDFVNVLTADGEVISSVTGSHTDLVGDYTRGDEINIEITSDQSVNGFGFKIEKVEVIY